MESNEIERYRVDQQLMNQYEYLTYSIAAGALGATNYGLTGGIVGFSLGGIDALAINYKFYTKPHLTAAVMSYSAFSSLKLPSIWSFLSQVEHINYFFQYHLSTTAIATELGWDTIIYGFSTTYSVKENLFQFFQLPISDLVSPIVGVLFTTGMLNRNLDTIMLLASGTVAGYSYGKVGKVYNSGYYGAIIGLSLGILDLNLDHYNITQNHYSTSYLKNVALTHTLLPAVLNTGMNAVYYILPLSLTALFPKINQNPQVIFRLTHVPTLLLTLYFSESKSNKKKEHSLLKLNKLTYDLYKEIIPEEELNDLSTKGTISLITNELMFISLTLTVDKHKNSIYRTITNLNLPDGWIAFSDVFGGGLLSIGIHFASGLICRGFINDFFQTKINIKIKKYLQTKILSNETALYLIEHNLNNSTHSNILVKNQLDDLRLLAESNALLADGISTLVSGICAISYLYGHNLDAILWPYVYNKITGSITRAMAIEENSSSKEIEEIKTEKSRLMEYLMLNAKSATQQQKIPFIYDKFSELNDKSTYLESIQATWKILTTIWHPVLGLFDYFTNYWITGNEISIDISLKDKIWALVNFRARVSKMMGWGAINAGKLIPLEQAILRLSELTKKIKMADKVNNVNELNYVYKESEFNFIYFKNLTIGVGNESRLHLDNLYVKERIVAITGNSGGGKSTFLTIVKQIKSSNAWGTGEIEYHLKGNKSPNILMASQEETLIPDSTLLELLTLKKHSEAKEHELEITNLLREIGMSIYIPRLHNKDDWGRILSGGEKQSCLVVTMIYKTLSLGEPNYVFLDEIFKGMDPALIKTAQRMLSSYIPNAQFFSVEHHLLSNNYPHLDSKTNKYQPFYNAKLDLVNNSAIIQLIEDDQTSVNGECINSIEASIA